MRAVRIVILFLLVALAWHALNVGMDGLAQRQLCQEDMPCWDCSTMGNHLCGP